MRKFISLFFLVLFVFSSQAEFKIDSVNHVQNDIKGRCAWASMETAGLTNGWNEVKDWTKNHPYPINYIQIMDELTKAKIKYNKFCFENKEFYYLVKTDKKTYKILDNKKEADELILSKGKDWYHERYHCWDISFLKKAVNKNLGSIVIVHNVNGLHAMIVADITDNKVKFIDSNSPKGVIREENIEWFLNNWVGFAVTIEKK